MKRNVISIFIVIPIFLFGFWGCKSLTKELIVLEEIKPSEVVAKEDPKLEPVVGSIIEINKINGEQKIIYIKFNKSVPQLKVGLLGFIYNDPEFKTKIGKFVIDKIFANNMGEGQISELNYEIKQKDLVVVEVDPRFLIQ